MLNERDKNLIKNLVGIQEIYVNGLVEIVDYLTKFMPIYMSEEHCSIVGENLNNIINKIRAQTDPRYDVIKNYAAQILKENDTRESELDFMKINWAKTSKGEN